jgi:hypothetical protein
MAGPLIVVGGGTIIGSDLHCPAGKSHHVAGDLYKLDRRCKPLKGCVWGTLLELKRLQHRFVVLVLVLQNHLVDVTVTQQGIGVVRLDFVQPRQYA